MRQTARNVLLLLGVLFGPGFAHAAEGVGLQTSVTLGGTPLECRDFRGHVVRAIRLDDLGDVAHARIINRMPIITLNQNRLDSLPVKLQIFFFNHECAHHVMGHVFYPTATSENEADCWSVKQGRRAGLLNREDVVAFGPHIAHSRGSAYGHLPGPQRAARLIACFDDPSEENYADPAGFTSPDPPSKIAEGVR